MTLRSFYIKPLYNSIRDDPYSEFFVPSFTNSNSYWRYGGFFSSKNLALCAEGIQEFLKSDGVMKLVLVPIFSKEDAKAIQDGILTPEKFINDSWSRDIDAIKEKFQKDHVRALSWLIAQTPPRLEIKIAILKDVHGNILDKKTIEESGLAYRSIGIFHDEFGNSISFRGIIKPNSIDGDDFFEFQVHKSWIDGQKEFVNEDFETFQNYWDESSEMDENQIRKKFLVQVLTLPEAIRKKLLDLAPKNLDGLDLKKLPKLRKYQKDAVNEWLIHGGRGIFEMATGTGKTYCAIGCLKEIALKEKMMCTIIVCPTLNLVKQWESELKRWYLESMTTLGDKKKWVPALQRLINDYNYHLSSNPPIGIIITTYATFSSKDFLDLVNKIQISTMLIADEVHSSGAEQTRMGLSDIFHFRLGLSATPTRYFDDEGTQIISNYFKPVYQCQQCSEHGSVIFSLELRDAIPEFLVEYDYFPHYVSLTDEELDEYRAKTKQIAIHLSNTKDEKKKNELLEMFYFQRSNIIKNASKKIEKFKEIINDNKSLDYCVVYCASTREKGKLDQITQVQEILDQIPIPNHRIKSGEISLNERMEVLDELEKGSIKVVIAIQILDEGVDIPPLKNAIILASTGNPRQFVQRRGRVLRKWGGTYPDGTTKTHSTIHDIFVIPYLDREIDKEYMSLEKKIVMKELVRHKEMAEISRNPNYGLQRITQIKEKYGIVSDNLQ